jgi:hypothetical protein
MNNVAFNREQNGFLFYLFNGMLAFVLILLVVGVHCLFEEQVAGCFKFIGFSALREPMTHLSSYTGTYTILSSIIATYTRRYYPPLKCKAL